MKRFLAFAILTLLAPAACGDSTPTPAGKADNVTSNADKKSNTKDAGAPSAANGKASAAPSAATCGAKATHSECSDCCDGKDEVNRKAGTTAYQTCLCTTAKAKCTAECAKSYCDDSLGETSSGESNPCAACRVVEADFEKCDAAAKKACDADPLCAAATKCETESKCESKPKGADEDENDKTPPPTPDDAK